MQKDRLRKENGMKREKKWILVLLVAVALLAMGGIGWKLLRRDMPSVPLLFYTREGQYHVYDKKAGDWILCEDEDWTEYVIEVESQFYRIGKVSVDVDGHGGQMVVFADKNFRPFKAGKRDPEKTVYRLDSRTAYVVVAVSRDEESRLTLRGILTRAGMKEKTKVEASMPTGAFAGKYMSVLGDSISACENYIPQGYLTFYPHGDVGLPDIWWYRLAKQTGMYICSNNSCGSSGVTRLEGGGLTPEMAASCGRGARLHQAGQRPDVIFVLMGGNDILSGASRVDIDRSYRSMLRDITATYPGAEIYLCMYHPCRLDTVDPEGWLRQEIQEVASDFGVSVLDLGACGITPENQTEYLYESEGGQMGVHPNQAGMALIADCMERQLSERKK